MSRLDELIRDLCPDGIEFRGLGTLGRRNKGTLITAGHMKAIAQVSGPVRIFAGGATIADVSADSVPSKDIVCEPSIIVKSRGHIGFEYYEKAFTHKSELWSYTINDPAVIQKFVYYYLLTRVGELQEVARATSVKLPQLSIKDTDFLRIPVPPLEVQHEIVRILDKFTQLEAELEAELEARRRQYGHYSGALLESNQDVHQGCLGDLCTIARGASPRPIRSFITDDAEGVPWIKIGDVPSTGKYVTGASQRITPAGAQKSRRVKPGDFILSNSMSFGRPYISGIEGCVHDGWLVISDFEDSFLPDYLYYLLRSAPVQAEFERRAGSGTVKNLNADIVKSMTVPLPPRDKQEQVVAVLDKFDVLVNDLSTGLPAELNARRKQYEYYRDKLLTFKDLA